MRNVDEFILYGHHHDRADHYEIPLFQMTMNKEGERYGPHHR
jgi:hypothetical protein